MKVTPKRQTWINHINSWNQSSLTVAGYARQHNLKLRHLYYIKSVLTKAGLLDNKPTLSKESPRAKFSKVQVLHETPPTVTQQCEIKMPSGLALRFDARLPMPTLRAIVIALGETNP